MLGKNNLKRNTLNKMFNYDGDSGKLYHAYDKRGNALKGVEAGWLTNNGYREVQIHLKTYKVHRVIYTMMLGEVKKQLHIDHINHIRDDNRLENLRLVLPNQNMKNKSEYKNNSSGVVGVHWNKKSKNWVARINIKGERKSLGSYLKFTDALDARKNAEVLYGYHKNHGGKKC